MTEPGTLWEHLSEGEKRKTKKALRKIVGKKWGRLQRELMKFNNAIDMERNHRGEASADNVQKRDDILREMFKLSREMVP